MMIQLLYTNSCGLYNKLQELKQSIALYGSDLVCVTETHFARDILDAEISIDGYIAFRNDRNFTIHGTDSVSNGGGSIVYVSDRLTPTRIEEFNACDSLAVQISTNVGLVNIVCIYRSVSLNSEQNSLLLKAVNCVLESDTETVIVGDFNLPNISWTTGVLNAPLDSKNKLMKVQKEWLNLVENSGLTWLLTDEITRRRAFGTTIQESLLDQLFVTNDAMVSDHKIVSPLGKSDHVVLNVELSMYSPGVLLPRTECHKTARSWGKVTPKDLQEFSNVINWEYSSESLSVNEMWQEIHEKLISVTENVPERKVKRMPWANSSLKRARKVKDRAWQSFDSDPTPLNMNIALSKQGLFEELDRKAKVKYEKLITSNLKQNCKPFYAYLRSKRVMKSKVCSLLKPDGSLTKTDQDTAEALATAFASVFVKEPAGPLDRHCYPNVEGTEIGDIVINYDNVKHELSKLDISKSQGPDDIHPKLLKSLSSNVIFVSAICKLFQRCAEDSLIPEQWKVAHVTSLYKKGSKKEPLNYRPVSLTCILSKTYEKFVRRHIMNHIEQQLSSDQHGFVEHKSCLSNLLETVETIIDMIDKGEPVDVFYFDFMKAFDSVPHFRLLTKMENMGITGKTLNIVRDFLSGRSFKTYVGGTLSFLRAVLSGVPQGSVLGPLLFVIFINDLPDCIKAISKLFADDLKAIVNADSVIENRNMLLDLQRWEETWLLRFNPSKCKVMHLDFNENPKHEHIFNDVMLSSVESEKDLGVVVTEQLLWKDQMKGCISKANQMISWVTRNLILRDKYVMRNVYKTVIRPHIEYCTQLWSPTAKHGNWAQIMEIENVQRRFTRLIDDVGTLPYSGRLQALKLTTLAERRNRGDLIETFKIVNGIVDYGRNLFNKSRSGSKLLVKPSFNSHRKVREVHDSFLPHRVINFWNKLPSEVRLCCNVEEFKIKLEKFKLDNIHLAETGNFWDVSEVVLNKIEGKSYLDNKVKQLEYLKHNPGVAIRKGINLRGS